MSEEQVAYSLHFQSQFENVLPRSKNVKNTAFNSTDSARYQVSKTETK